MKNERQKKILIEVIKEHIRSRHSVSSGHLADMKMFDCSPATIRNELVVLENEGYLMQPHTSSGRVPTFKGYREYVNNITKIKPLSKEELAMVAKAKTQIFNDIEGVLQNAMNVVAQLSDYAVVLSLHSTRKTILKYLQLILLNVHEVLLVILSNTGKNKDVIIELDDASLTQDELNNLSEYLHSILIGKDISEINETDIQDIIDKFPVYEKFLKKAFEAINFQAGLVEDQSLNVKNYSKLIQQPDFEDVHQIKEIIGIIEREKDLAKCLLQAEDGVQVVIGNEMEESSMQDLALVSSRISINEDSSACLAIVGPKRMDYEKSVSQLKAVTKYIQDKVSTIAV
jgi:heat-inducible transcriptional repressor